MVDWWRALQDLWNGLQAGIYPDLGVWSYVLLAMLVATEGPLSTLLGASAAAAGYLDIRFVYIATLIGNVTGDTLWYTIGYQGRVKWLLEHGRWFGLRPHHLARLEREMHSHATKLIVFAKIAYGLIVPTLLAAGIARVPWRRWFPIVFVVETLWSLLLVWVGFHATGLISRFARGLEYIGAAVLIGIAVALIWFLRKRIDRQELEMDPLRQVVEAAPLSEAEELARLYQHLVEDHGHAGLRAGDRANQPKVKPDNQPEKQWIK